MLDEMTLGKASKFAIFYNFKNQKSCFSHFELSEKRSGNWGYCSCQIKQSIIDYLSITKQEMLTKKEETLTTLEITLIVIVCVSLVMSIGIGVGGVVYWKRNNNQMPGINNGVFIPNPLYQNPEA